MKKNLKTLFIIILIFTTIAAAHLFLFLIALSVIWPISHIMYLLPGVALKLIVGFMGVYLLSLAMKSGFEVLK